MVPGRTCTGLCNPDLLPRAGVLCCNPFWGVQRRPDRGLGMAAEMETIEGYSSGSSCPGPVCPVARLPGHATETCFLGQP